MGKDMTPEESKAFEEKIYAYVGRENGSPHRANDDVNTAPRANKPGSDINEIESSPKLISLSQPTALVLS
jgi:hypothetical protein